MKRLDKNRNGKTRRKLWMLAAAAVVVLQTGTREVRAMVGSAGFLEAGRQGQVNGALARRSPGSTPRPGKCLNTLHPSTSSAP